MLGDVATVIANRIEFNIYDTLMNSNQVPEYNTIQTEDTMEAFGQFVIAAQEAFKGNAGAGADLTIWQSHTKHYHTSNNLLTKTTS